MLAPLRVAVPPSNYGGTERCIWNLTEALVKLGHDVTLFAPGDSTTTAKLEKVVPQALGFVAGMEWQAYQIAMLADVYRRANDFDIFHAHMDYYPLPFAEQSPTPTVSTLHGRIDSPEFQKVYSAFPGANFIAISESQRTFLPDIHWVGVVHHAIDVAEFKFYPKPGEYLAFVGRISPEKRPDRAIEVAKRTGIPLKMAAKIDPNDQEYYETKIKPLMKSKLIEFIGPVNEQDKRKLMGESLAVIMPIDWPEPFGIVFIEALACGAPVLTCPCGSVPELLEDGVTGFIRKDVDGLVAAVKRLGEIDRHAVRRYAAQRFDTRRMAEEYVTIYSQVIQDNAMYPTLSVVEAEKVVAEKIAKIAAEEVLEDHAKMLPINAAITIDESTTLP
jgi:glycosyltransferase involved in cell wall biosynthesis